MNHTKVKETLKHLRIALKDELKQDNFYKKAAEVAKEEGLSSAAEFFRNAAKDEKRHAAEIENILRALSS
ncbi:MAG TPA: ferritin family protein [Candidatus Paceibacterota bacterium]|nr:ferritin family protein [Candidatus Paceibacterota bacterium]